MATPADIAEHIECSLEDMRVEEGDGHYSDIQNIGQGRILASYVDPDGDKRMFTIEVRAL